MSQPNTPFNDSAVDIFLSSIDDYSQDQLDALFTCNTSDEPAFSSSTTTNSGVLDEDFDFSFSDTFDSSNPSAISTPDFSSYNLSRPTSSYPLPNTGSPQPYFQSRLHPTSTSRPQPIHTNSEFLLPNHPPSNYTRRRSLSTNDIPLNPHPTFIRLQSARSRSTTPEEKRRAPYTKHHRSRSQGPGTPGTPGRPLKNAVALGTPLKEERKVRMRTIGHAHASSEPAPVMRRMEPEAMEHSRRIIQIGAMSVRDSPAVDPALETTHERIGRMLHDIKHYLQGDAEALKGVDLIRQALAKVGLEDPDRDIEHMSLDGEMRSLGMCGGEEELFGFFLEDGGFAGLLGQQE